MIKKTLKMGFFIMALGNDIIITTAKIIIESDIKLLLFPPIV